MALGATMYVFEVRLADADRAVYETLTIRAARHPSESAEYLTGVMQAWIEIGVPDANRLHKAAKAAPKVAVYVHRDVDQLLSRLAGERIHRADALESYALERGLVAGWWRVSIGA